MENDLMPELDGRVPSLDGLRALSILLVLFSHASTWPGFPDMPKVIPAILNGQLGVRIFFVISGFIITLLLLKEEQRAGAFSIKNFYIRRVWRILPVYYAFLLVMIAFVHLNGLEIGVFEFAAAFTFTTGWWERNVWLLGHAWSLSVEEQFYLLWPLALYLVRTRRNRFILVLLTIAIYPLMKVGVYLSSLESRRAFLFITQGDCIIMGCCLALMLFYDGKRVRHMFTRYVTLLRVVGFALIAAVTWLEYRSMWGILTVPLSSSIQSLIIAWLIGSFIFNKDFLYAFLNARVIVFIGTVSYSWYIWQQPFFTVSWLGFPMNVIASFGVAIVSYYVIELPISKRKERLMPKFHGT
jgi:peptidoglycan/LPS O-acetylase OafA/YrhL